MAKKQTKKQDKTAPAAPNLTVQLPEGFRAKRQVTMPTLVIKETNQVKILTINDAMHLSKYVEKDPKKAKEEPATVCGVTDVESGEVMEFIVPSVVKSQLERQYPDESYVGLTFRIACLGKRAGKRYRDFSIIEVEKQ